MPYVAVNSCKTPDPDTKIWRYMDFMKFVDLVSSKKMFLCRADQLQDKNEGRMPNQFYEALKNPAYLNPDVPGLTVDVIQKLAKGALGQIRTSMYIGCWHMNPYESIGMWKSFVPDGNGIAIQATVGRLIDSISQCEATIHIGRIRYTDHQRIGEEGMNPFAAYILKSMKYDYEKEVRILLPYLNGVNIETYGLGIRIPINVSSLIESVYLPSESEKWKVDTIKETLKTYGLNCKVNIFED